MQAALQLRGEVRGCGGGGVRGRAMLPPKDPHISTSSRPSATRALGHDLGLGGVTLVTDSEQSSWGWDEKLPLE